MTFDFLAMKTTSTSERRAEKERLKEEERAKTQAIEQVCVCVCWSVFSVRNVVIVQLEWDDFYLHNGEKKDPGMTGNCSNLFTCYLKHFVNEYVHMCV